MNQISLWLTVPTVAACVVLNPGCASSPLTTKVEQPSLLAAAKSIAVRDFSTNGATIVYAGNVDTLSRVMAFYLCGKLREMSDDLSIVLDTAATSMSDLIVEGQFNVIDEGSESERVLIGSGGATVAVSGIIKASDGSIVADFRKSKTSSGGPIGLGGILSGSGMQIVDDNMEDIAEDLAGFIIENRRP